MKTSTFLKLPLALAALLSLGAQAAPSDVYVMSNAADGNQVAMLSRAPDGTLHVAGKFATGGTGTGVGIITPADPLGSQNALVLSGSRKWLFAVNAGSNQVSVFRVLRNKLVLASVTASGGRFPVSVAERDGVLYVLNAGDEGNVSGFHVEADGQLRPLPGGVHSLHGHVPDVGGFPDILRAGAQIQFSPDGDWLVLTRKNLDGHGTIERFAVNQYGGLGDAALVTESPDPVPFGFTFNARGQLLVTEAIAGTVSSYRLGEHGALAELGRTVSNGQAALCWIDTTRQFAYASNTLSDTLSGYKMARDGTMTLLNADGVTARVPAGANPVDVKISADGYFVNVVNSGAGTVGTYRINPIDGALKLVGETQVFPALSGMEGMAAE